MLVKTAFVKIKNSVQNARRFIKKKIYVVIHFITNIFGEYLQQDTYCLEDTSRMPMLKWLISILSPYYYTSAKDCTAKQ